MLTNSPGPEQAAWEGVGRCGKRGLATALLCPSAGWAGSVCLDGGRAGRGAAGAWLPHPGSGFAFGAGVGAPPGLLRAEVWGRFCRALPCFCEPQPESQCQGPTSAARPPYACSCKIQETLGLLVSCGSLAVFPGASARPAVSQVGLLVLLLLGNMLAAYKKVRRSGACGAAPGRGS